MPFTFSHPAIILPLNYLPRKWFSLTGLIIGSLIPDFEYFIRMKVQSIYSHTFLGIFWFDLPLALLTAFLFHDIVRNDLFNNLPEIIKTRVFIFKEFNWNDYFKANFFIVLISLLIGIASHLFWDSFTHEHGYFVDHISNLKENITIFNQKIPAFKILQHLSTFLGAIIIITTVYKLPKTKISKLRINKKYWLIVIAQIIVILILRVSLEQNYNTLGHLIVSLISATLISLIVTPFLIKSITFAVPKGQKKFN